MVFYATSQFPSNTDHLAGLVSCCVGCASSLNRHCTRRPGTAGVKGLEAAAQKTPAPTHSSREISGLSAGHCNVGSETQKLGCDKQPSWSPGLPSEFWEHQVSVTDSFLVTNVPRDYFKS